MIDYPAIRGEIVQSFVLSSFNWLRSENSIWKNVQILTILVFSAVFGHFQIVVQLTLKPTGPMHLKHILSILAIALFLLLTLSRSAGESPQLNAEVQLPLEMVQAAQAIINITPTDQTDKLIYTFDSDERTFWNFVPMTGKRKGLSLEDMSIEQRKAVHTLLQSALSAKGYLKVTGIQQLEKLLGEFEKRPDYRDPAAYFLTIFGAPSVDSPWGWRFEGHHLSLNFSSVENELSATPAFMGANPAMVGEGPFAGMRVLREEIDVARRLMATLSPAQRSKAIIAEVAPREIITGNAREAAMETFEGLRFDELEPSQQAMLKDLLQVYAGNLTAEAAQAQMQRIEAAGFDALYFAWAGSVDDPLAAHYYRIHGPTVLIEYDNTQNNANHIHSVWRDLTNDFGRDLLHEHYEAAGTGHGH